MSYPGPSAGFWKGGWGAGEGLVGDCGLVFPWEDRGFPVKGCVLKKFGRGKRGAKIFVIFCVKNQDFMQKILFFSNFRGGALESTS